MKKLNASDLKEKFIKEFNEDGFCRLTFGGGNGSLNVFSNTLANIENFSFYTPNYI